MGTTQTPNREQLHRIKRVEREQPREQQTTRLNARGTRPKWTTQSPAKCRFFGSNDKQGYCSVCFKKEVEKQEKKDPDSIKQKDNSRLPSSESSSSSNSSDPKITDQMADLMKPSSPPSTPD